ncbi:MAG: nuclear transport factor 2 family protein [Rhodococcus sp. (in: high G+C Gram-positive bacteria)]
MKTTAEFEARIAALERVVEHAETAICRLAAKEEIRDRILSVSRGLDRLDRRMLESAFHPDAHIDFGGIYAGPVAGFIESTLQFQRKQFRVQHLVAGILVHLSGDTASAESYELARHRHEENGATVELVIAGRYLDHLAQQDGRWLITRRVKVLDAGRATTVSEDWLANSPLPVGTRDCDDLSYGISD